MLPVILKYVDAPDQGIRPVALEAVGKIGGSEAIAVLREQYLIEPSKRYRMTIIDGILRHGDVQVRKDVLAQFQAVESDGFLKTILSRRLSEL